MILTTTVYSSGPNNPHELLNFTNITSRPVHTHSPSPCLFQKPAWWVGNGKWPSIEGTTGWRRDREREREGGKEEEEGRTEGGREGENKEGERGRERGREGSGEEGREGRREGSGEEGREGRRERGKGSIKEVHHLVSFQLCLKTDRTEHP